MATRILRWGLISTARINRALIPPLRASARNQLVAVASREMDKAQAYAKEWNIPRVFGSYEAMLADLDIDVVYNPLPNGLHAEWTIKAAQAGKHVLCEKPFAVTVEQVDAMAAAAQKAGVVVAEAFMYRHHPQTLKVQELVESGAIGKLRLVHGSFTYNLTNELNVRLNPALDGGSIWDVGCYPISYARYVIGAEPVEVFGWQVTGPTGVDMTFTGQMHFARDVLAQFDCSFRMPDRAHIEVVGSEGIIDVPDPFKPERDYKILLTRNNETETLAIPNQMLYLGEVEDMADAILLGKAPRVSLADSRGNVAAIVALLQSAREGRPVAVR
jgi:D-xylose 1-dehydrogenase (NADP+, D-xylono-1,5-lactone-forming)